MRVAVLGFEGPLAAEIRALLTAKSHVLDSVSPECVIYLPGTLTELKQVVGRGGFRRLVLRSHAGVYGASRKNPGLVTEESPSRLPADAPEQRWLHAERIAAQCSSWAAVRLTHVLAEGEGDLLVRQIAGKVATPLAGYDPNVQFISLRDAAWALLAAAESNATGVFNVTGEGVIPLKKALLAAGTMRVPIPRPLNRVLGGAAREQLRYNWTISGEKAERLLGFRPERSTVEALAEFLKGKPGARPERLRKHYDEWGLDLDYIRAWSWWFAFVRKVYWRVEIEGVEHIPESGRAMFVSNHRGFMPLDGVIHVFELLARGRRIPRFLIIPSLLSMPFLCNFLTKMGGVIANQENAARLFAQEDLVGMFPEGIRGIFTPYKTAYRLREFDRSAFAKMAIEHQAPIIPAAVIGHAEIFPIIGRIESSHFRRVHGWPYFPIAPLFPLAPIPIPSKWHIRILEPIPVDGLAPADAENPELVRDFARHIREIMQQNIDDMVRRRKSIFWGRILDGTGPQAPRFERSPTQLTGETAN